MSVRLMELMQYPSVTGSEALAIETVAKVGVAPGAANLGADHAVGVIFHVAIMPGNASSNDGQPQFDINV